MKFKRGDLVKKIKGSHWCGRICGEYSTPLTEEGYAVESLFEAGSVQIYPAAALELIHKNDVPYLVALHNEIQAYHRALP